ncbi:MAG: hypothetical protein GQ549_06020 [Gammaproteobacteria bacterium]|nr:hypothetical protein [Gammaproteobacteria bacterium]
MENKHLISCKKNYVEARSDGPNTLELIMNLWKKIIDACIECTCFNILNISNSALPVTVNDAINHLKSFEHLEITTDYRIALVELNPACSKSSLLVESILLTHGMNIRTFLNIDDAKCWLFHGRKI